jgi:hypothetical protein
MEFMQARQVEVQDYFDKGYLTTKDGEFFEYPDFNEEWA